MYRIKYTSPSPLFPCFLTWYLFFFFYQLSEYTTGILFAVFGSLLSLVGSSSLDIQMRLEIGRVTYMAKGQYIIEVAGQQNQPILY